MGKRLQLVLDMLERAKWTPKNGREWCLEQEIRAPLKADKRGGSDGAGRTIVAGVASECEGNFSMYQ